MSAKSAHCVRRRGARELHLAVANFPRALLEPWWPDVDWDREHVTVVRSCLIKPEHAPWMEKIWTALERVIPA